MKTIAMIPARMGSQRLAKKNLRELDGVSLIARAIRRVVSMKLGFVESSGIWTLYGTWNLARDSLRERCGLRLRGKIKCGTMLIPVDNWCTFLDECRKHGLDGRHSNHLRQDGDPELTSAERFVACTKWAESIHPCAG